MVLIFSCSDGHFNKDSDCVNMILCQEISIRDKLYNSHSSA